MAEPWRQRVELLTGDCLSVMAGMAPASVDLVFGSPPYEDARTYGIGVRMKGQDWVDWMVEVVKASLRVSRGPVGFVVEGRTRKFRYSATPILLMADLHRAGVCLRKPPVFYRVGIAGSGGPDWLRNDFEFVVCCTNGGRLPWSENTVMGHPPKYAPGGAMSHRTTSGARVNQWGHPFDSGGTGGPKDDVTCQKPRPSHFVVGKRITSQTRRKPDGTRPRDGTYVSPVLANPGNVIHCKVGGGLMGSPLAHENEAPFPERLAEFFIRSFCPPDGVVLDPFLGGGTTAAVALKWGRRAIGIDVRDSQIDLTRRRLKEVADAAPLFTQEKPHA